MKYKKDNYIEGLKEYKESKIKSKMVTCRLTEEQYDQLVSITEKNDVSITEFFEHVIKESYELLPKKRVRPSSSKHKNKTRSRK